MNIDILNAYCGPWLLFTVHVWLRVGFISIPNLFGHWALSLETWSGFKILCCGSLLPRDPREFIPGLQAWLAFKQRAVEDLISRPDLYFST